MDIALTVLGGLGLFLYGMTMMSAGLQKTAGNELKKSREYATIITAKNRKNLRNGEIANEEDSCTAAGHCYGHRPGCLRRAGCRPHQGSGRFQCSLHHRGQHCLCSRHSPPDHHQREAGYRHYAEHQGSEL